MPIDGPEAVSRAHVVGGNPYDRVALDAWQAIRPGQPKFTDRRAGEHADLLFASRARKVPGPRSLPCGATRSRQRDPNLIGWDLICAGVRPVAWIIVFMASMCSSMPRVGGCP